MAEGRSVMTSGCDVYDDGVLRVMRVGSPPVVVIAGEIDESNYSGLVGALDRLVDGPSEVHVNLAKVEFCDLAGLRAIIRLTEIGQAGHDVRARRLVLHEVPRQVRRVLQIMGWDTLPGLTMQESGFEGW
jgi:anti-anti-sigma factor